MPIDVDRGGLAPGAATDAFTQEPVAGVDGDLLRAKAIREGLLTTCASPPAS